MTENLIKPENIVSRIYFIRGEKVMLDSDLALLYAVETRIMNQAVKRNIDRFPEDFMFRLTIQELRALKSQVGIDNDEDTSNSSQFVMSSRKHRGSIYLPLVFTEQGVAMLSGILKSKSAIEVNIAIMRTFVQLRKLMDTNKELAKKIDSLEEKYDEQFQTVFQAIRQLIHKENKPRKIIGYKTK